MSDADRKPRRPLYLLADSQLLFWKHRNRPLLAAALDGLPRDARLSAAYIGASNGDRPEFYEIFEAAMDTIGITSRRMIDSSFGPEERAFLQGSQLIVLAGGDVRLGWTTFENTGMKDAILSRYTDGAILVGISAGAVQLGQYGIDETPHPARPGCSRCSSSSPRSSTRTTSVPTGRGYRARFDRCKERPPGSGSRPGAESSSTRMGASRRCGARHTNSGSRAHMSRTRCCAWKAKSDKSFRSCSRSQAQLRESRPYPGRLF